MDIEHPTVVDHSTCMYKSPDDDDDDDGDDDDYGDDENDGDDEERIVHITLLHPCWALTSRKGSGQNHDPQYKT